MESIPLPTKVEITESKKDSATFVIEPCYPGYGTTLGNALRRVLLSSLSGAAITAVRIDGADHEFSTIPFVKEDVVAIILNLKLVRFALHGEGPVTLTLKANGEKNVTASDFVGPSEVSVVNGKQPIASLTDKAATLSMEITVSAGRGYVPVENREKEKMDIGWISIDSVFTPMKTVNFSVENVRVGQMTNYDKLILNVETDGTIDPGAAVAASSKILVEHFSEFMKFNATPLVEPTTKKRKARVKKEDKEPAITEPVAEPATEHDHAAS